MDDLEKELGLVAQNEVLRKQIVKLESRIEHLEKLLKENGLEEELESVGKHVTDEEYICVDQIKKLKLSCEQGELLDVGQVKNLHTLFSILRSIRTGQEIKPSSKAKKADIAELFKIVGSNE